MGALAEVDLSKQDAFIQACLKYTILTNPSFANQLNRLNSQYLQHLMFEKHFENTHVFTNQGEWLLYCAYDCSLDPSLHGKKEICG